jgi:chromosome segregation ATPase
MGGAKSLLNFFIKVEEDGKDDPKGLPNGEVKQVATPAPSVAPITSSAAHEDAEIKKQLFAALEQANQPGYDYFEMAKAIEAQASIIPSEELRFQSTAAAVASLGVTPDKLISSAQFYLSILKKKEDEFNKTLAEHMAESVTSREDEVKKYDADMQAKSGQIQKLTQEINELQQRKTAIINEVSSSRAQIEQVKNNFYATMGIFVERINSDISKIKTYLMKTA